MIKIGILALQGDLEEHDNITKKALEKLGLKGEVLLVKKPEEIESLDGLIITGGESTVFGKVSSRLNVFSTIKQLSSKKVPLFGTCHISHSISFDFHFSCIKLASYFH